MFWRASLWCLSFGFFLGVVCLTACRQRQHVHVVVVEPVVVVVVGPVVIVVVGAVALLRRTTTRSSSRPTLGEQLGEQVFLEVFL